MAVAVIKEIDSGYVCYHGGHDTSKIEVTQLESKKGFEIVYSSTTYERSVPTMYSCIEAKLENECFEKAKACALEILIKNVTGSSELDTTFSGTALPHNTPTPHDSTKIKFLNTWKFLYVNDKT